MHGTLSLVAFAATLNSALAAYQGFNYGSTFTTGAAKQQSDFEAEFKAAQGLAGTNGAFNSARLYTMIQAGTANDPISAIPAALSTETSLLLGLWASAGDAAFASEVTALKAAISTYGDKLGPLVAGISVGSEDLYRITPTGIANGENPGAGPDVISKYIQQVKDAIKGTPLSGAPVGHVDTWTAWVNGTNKPVIDACDWVGIDAYPYFEPTHPNAIDQDAGLFQTAFDATQGAVGGKPVWITETGFPVSGKTSGAAVPSVQNAKQYWDQVGCPRFGKTNVWWYTMLDAAPSTPNPSFGIIASLGGQPLYDLSCSNVDTASSTTKAPSSSTASPAGSTTSAAGSGASATGSMTTIVTSSSGSASATIGGGSPGQGGSGIASSQLSIETASPSSGSSGSGSGAGSNGTLTGTPKPTSAPTTVPNEGVSKPPGSIIAAFAAIMVAILAI